MGLSKHRINANDVQAVSVVARLECIETRAYKNIHGYVRRTTVISALGRTCAPCRGQSSKGRMKFPRRVREDPLWIPHRVSRARKGTRTDSRHVFNDISSFQLLVRDNPCEVVGEEMGM